MNDPTRYRAFLSYSHEDERWARWLHRALESYRVPKRLRADNPGIPAHLKPVFRDREDLASSASLPSLVQRVLEHSEALIVICSPAAAASKWVNEEIRIFRRLGRGERIFCVVVAGEPGDGGDCFPPALHEPVALDDGRRAAALEPIAADLRPGRDSKHDALMRLVAGLLDVPLDRLIQRDLHRRQRQMIRITALSTVLALVIGILAVTALVSQREAREQGARWTDLQDWMLDEMAQTLDETGTLREHEDLVRTALENLGEVDPEKADEQTLGRFYSGLTQLGQVHREAGRPALAMSTFERALDAAERRVALIPDDLEARMELADAHYWVGRVHWDAGRLDEAAQAFDQQGAIMAEVAAAAPDDPGAQLWHGYAVTNNGRFHERTGQFEQAEARYQQVMAINQRVENSFPDHEDAANEVGFAHNNLGVLALSMGSFEAAAEHLEADLVVKQAMLATDPGSHFFREDVASAHYFVGRVFHARGEWDAAAMHFDRAIEEMQLLIGRDPDQTEWPMRAAMFNIAQASVARQQGQAETAAGLLDEAIRSLESLIEDDSLNSQWHRQLVRAHVQAARVAAARGQPGVAAQHLAAADRIVEPLLVREPWSWEVQLLGVQVQVLSGDFAPARTDGEPFWRSAAQQVSEIVPEYDMPEKLDLVAAVAQRLGDEALEERSRSRLEEMGYVPDWSAGETVPPDIPTP